MDDSVRVAAAIVSKLFPAYADSHGLTEIEAFVKATISILFTEAEVVVRVPEQLADELAARLVPVAAACGLGDNLKFVPDATLGPADCRMEWSDGGAERIGDQLLAEIDAIVARFVEHNEMPETAITPEEKPAEIAQHDQDIHTGDPALRDETVEASEHNQDFQAPETAPDEQTGDGAAFAGEIRGPEDSEIVAPPEQEPEVSEPSVPNADQMPAEGIEIEQPSHEEVPMVEPQPVELPAIVLPPIEPSTPPPGEAPAPATLPGAIDTAAPKPSN